MVFDINTTLQTLVGDWGVSTTPFERELFLYYFQTWIYFPRPASEARTAITLAAARFLEDLGKKYLEAKGLRSLYRNSSVRLEKCLADDEYRSLYNRALKSEGGWTALLRTPSLADFDKKLQRRRTEATIVCDIIDYRFRYLEHGGERKQDANINHGHFYRWKKGLETGRTIRTHWSNTKESSIFLYVNERFDPFMIPPEIAKEDFIKVISERARDQKKINAYFGLCRYVVDTLRGSDPLEPVIQMPNSVKSVRPNTQPFSDTELEWMKNYNLERDELRDYRLREPRA